MGARSSIQGPGAWFRAQVLGSGPRCSVWGPGAHFGAWGSNQGPGAPFGAQVLGSGPGARFRAQVLGSGPRCSVRGPVLGSGPRCSVQGPGARFGAWGAKECLLGTEFQKSPMKKKENLLPFTRTRPRGFLGRVKKRYRFLKKK